MLLRETEYDPWTGETKKWYFDENNNIVCHRSANLNALISNCKKGANATKGFSRKTKFHKVFSIPPIIQHKLLKEYNLDCFSNDPTEKKRLEKIIEQDIHVLKTNSYKLCRPT